MRIRDIYPGSGSRMFIPDPTFFHPGSEFFRAYKLNLEAFPCGGKRRKTARFVRNYGRCPEYGHFTVLK
jgi:hypothetical protein